MAGEIVTIDRRPNRARALEAIGNRDLPAIPHGLSDVLKAAGTNGGSLSIEMDEKSPDGSGRSLRIRFDKR